MNEEIIDSTDDNISKDELMEILLNTREQGQMVELLIKNQIEVKDEMIERLHKELESYKQDEAGRFVDQVMKGIIKVRKDMIRFMKSDKWEGIISEDLKREYCYVFEDLTDILEQQNIEIISTESGSDFDAAIHQPKLEETEDIGLDKKIKESISEGYRRGQRILQPERVIVYKYHRPVSG